MTGQKGTRKEMGQQGRVLSTYLCLWEANFVKRKKHDIEGKIKGVMELENAWYDDNIDRIYHIGQMLANKCKGQNVKLIVAKYPCSEYCVIQ